MFSKHSNKSQSGFMPLLMLAIATLGFFALSYAGYSHFAKTKQATPVALNTPELASPPEKYLKQKEESVTNSTPQVAGISTVTQEVKVVEKAVPTSKEEVRLAVADEMKALLVQGLIKGPKGEKGDKGDKGDVSFPIQQPANNLGQVLGISTNTPSNQLPQYAPIFYNPGNSQTLQSPLSSIGATSISSDKATINQSLTVNGPTTLTGNLNVTGAISGAGGVSGKLVIDSGTPTTAASGLQFGSDSLANLYRSATGTIKTDGILQSVSGAVFAPQVSGAGNIGGFYVTSSGYIGNNSTPVAPIDFSNTKLSYDAPAQILFADALIEGRGLTDISSFATVSVTGGTLIGGGPNYRCSNCRWQASGVGDSLTLDFGSNYNIIGVTFGSWFRTGCTLGGVAIDGSTNGTTWTNLGNPTYICTQIALFSHGGFTGPGLGNYRYIRITYNVGGVSPQMAGLQVFADNNSALWGTNMWGADISGGGTMWRGLGPNGGSGGVTIGTNTSGNYRLTLDNASAGTITLARLQNSQTAANNNASQIMFAANRTTSGLTDVAGVSGMITDITQGAYKGALIFSTANNAAPVERMRIDNSGNIGINTTSPSNSLHVSAGSLCVKSTTGNCSGSTAGTIYATTTTVQAADYAENYVSKTELEPGDVVSFDSNTINKEAIKKTISAYDTALAGVISTAPGVTLNSDIVTDATYQYIYPVGLSGRVPVKVTAENGEIHSGDYLTSSRQFPGYAMKASHSGNVIGIALENYASQESGKILVFLKPGYQIINNTFVLEQEDGQLISQLFKIETNTQDSALLVNQKGSGNLLTLQKDGTDSFIVKNNGSVHLSSNIQEIALPVLNISNQDKKLFVVYANGNLEITGNIKVGKNTSGKALLRLGDNRVKVKFTTPYITNPNVFVTLTGLPPVAYSVIEKNSVGFTIALAEPATSDRMFEWLALEQPEATDSESILILDSVSPNANPQENNTPQPQVQNQIQDQEPSKQETESEAKIPESIEAENNNGDIIKTE